MGSFASILTAVLAMTPPSGEAMVRLPPVQPATFFNEEVATDPFFSSAPLDPHGQPTGATFLAEPGPGDSLPGTQFRMAWLAERNRDSLGALDFDLNHSWLLGYDDWPPVTITPGLGLHLWSATQSVDLPPRVYDAYLDLSWKPIDGERWGVSMGLVPGWYGDFELWDSRSFQLTGWFLASYRVHDQFQVLGGLAYTRQLTSNLLPVGGILWTPNPETRVEILIPKPRIARKILETESSTTWVYVAGQLGGGTWAVADTASTNVLVTYSDLRFLVGLETFRYDGYECSLEAGYVWSRNISVESVSVFSPDDTVFLQATLAF